ncbi:MAG: hypothetical protein WA799_08965 [Nitrosotalea sp.]
MKTFDELNQEIRDLRQEVILSKELHNLDKDKLLELAKYGVRIQKHLPGVAIDISNIIGGETN